MYRGLAHWAWALPWACIAHSLLSSLQGSTGLYPRQSSAHAQRIAKAKWEFFYGSSDTPKTGKKLQADALGLPTPSFKSVLLAGLTLGLPIPWVFSVPSSELRFPQDWPAYVLLGSEHACTNLLTKSTVAVQKR